MALSKLRGGRFTSGQSHKLIKKGSVPMSPEELVIFKKANPGSRKKNKEAGFAAPGLTYIEETILELKLGRVLDTNIYSKPIAWGEFMEIWLFKSLGLNYQMINKETILHPAKNFAPYWCGTPDLKQEGVVTGEIKCYQPKKFAQFTDALILDAPEADKILNLKGNFPEEYWQVVSNSIILGTSKAELISFMPFESQMEAIKEEIELYEGPDLWRFRFIVEDDLDDLAVLPDGGYYDSINIFRFKVPTKDVEYLTSRVKEAIVELKKYKK